MVVRLGLAIVLLVSGCSASGSPSPVEPDGEYLAYPERIDLVVACVREQGFNAASYEGYGVRIEAASDAQVEAASRVEGECWEEVDERYPAPPPLSHEEQYYYMLDVAECLRELGYDIPEAPSLDAYIDQISPSNTTGNFWDPYYILSRRGVNTYEIEREKCPPSPWAR